MSDDINPIEPDLEEEMILVKALSNIDESSSKIIASLFKEAIINEDIVIQKSESGFGVKLSKISNLEKDLDLNEDEAHIILTNLVPSIYEIFQTGKIEENDNIDAEASEKLNKIVDFIDKDTKQHIISYLVSNLNSLYRIKHEILKKSIKTHDDCFEVQFVNLNLEYTTPNYKSENCNLVLSKLEIEKLIEKLKKIRSDVVGDKGE